MKKKRKYIGRYFGECWKTEKCGLMIAVVVMVLQSYLSLQLPEYLQSIVDKGIMKKCVSLIIQYSIIYIILVLITQAFNIGLNYFYSILKIKVVSKMKISLIEYMTRSNGKSISEQNSGETIRILDNDLFQLESFGVDLVLELIMSIVISIVAFVVMYQIHPLLLAVTFFVQVILFFLQYLFSKSITDNIKKVRNIAGEQSVLQEQLVTNLKNIILTNVTEYFLNLYGEHQNALVQQSNKVNALIYIHSGMSGIFFAFSTILTYLIGGILIVHGEISIGEVIAFSQYCVLLVAPFHRFISNNIQFKQSAVALEHIYNEFERIQTINVSESQRNIEGRISSLSFHHVTFSYRLKNVINDFDYTFRKGEITIITGQSGSGKSTLLNLIYRLWEPENGSIELNDIPITQYTLESLRKKICIVCQESPIFNQGIEENVCLNCENVTKEGLENVYQIVDIRQLMEKDRTLDTPLGEMGNRLSGGQKQRIALARALLRNYDVLILDECTSALDNISQQVIMEKMYSEWKDKIVIIIAHRLSITKFADRILVMDHGKIVETGTYNELLDKKGFFYSLAKSEKAG